MNSAAMHGKWNRAIHSIPDAVLDKEMPISWQHSLSRNLLRRSFMLYPSFKCGFPRAEVDFMDRPSDGDQTALFSWLNHRCSTSGEVCHPSAALSLNNLQSDHLCLHSQ